MSFSILAIELNALVKTDESECIFSEFLDTGY